MIRRDAPPRLALSRIFWALVFCLVFSSPAQSQDPSELAKLIDLSITNRQAVDFDRMLSLVKIESTAQADAFRALVDARLSASGSFASAEARTAFATELINTLDARRFARVDALLSEVAANFPGLEAAVRTGSSGYKTLGVTGSGYRPLFSDDDITFVGGGAAEAKSWFNGELANRGLAGVKVKGFTINDPGKFSPQDKNILDLLDPEKFVGQSAMSGIRSETMKKGAVVLGRGPDGKLTLMRTSLADYLNNTKTLKSALDSFVEDAAARYGPLTMISSVERQIVSAHKGWDNLSPAEQIKYVLRGRKKVAEGLGGLSDGSIETLEQMAAKFSSFPPPAITAEETAYLLARRKDNIVQAFESTNTRLMALVDARAGSDLAANPEVRAAVNELATAFAMLRDLKGSELGSVIDIEGVIGDLINNASGNPGLRKLLYTASAQADDMLRVLREWGSNEEGFARMLERLAAMTAPERYRALAERQHALESRAQAGTITEAESREAPVVAELAETVAKDGGDKFVLSMIALPSAKTTLIGLAATGGAILVKQMYARWKDGGYYDDLSGAAAALVDFVPGAMSFSKLNRDGYLSPAVAYQFVKDGLALTWLWPVTVAADVAEMSIDLGQGLSLQTYHDGLVDVLVANGDFADGKFTALRTADGETIPRDGLADFFKQDRSVKLKNTNRPDLQYAANLSQAAASVYAKYYVTNDPVLADLKKALLQQIGKINVTEGMKQFSDADWLEAAKSGFRLLFAVQGVCKSAPKHWCDLVTIYQTNIQKRTDDIFPRVMVPHLISLAEADHAALSGDNAAVKQFMGLQRDIEDLRGSPLGIDLAMEVSQRAAKASDLRPTAISGDTATSRDKSLAEGRYLQAALKAYQTMLDEAKQTRDDVASRSGYTASAVLGFGFSGDFYQDATRARQSRRGFMADTNKIVGDVTKIKGSAPDLLNDTDVKALGILAEVVYPNRTSLDAGNTDKPAATDNPASAAIPDLKPPVPGPSSPFAGWYKAALDKVKALYAGAADLKKLVAKGALLVPPGGPMTELAPGMFEVRLTAAALRSQWDAGKLDIAWSAEQPGVQFDYPGSLKTACTPSGAGDMTVTATFSLKSDPAVAAALSATVTVLAASQPLATIALSSAAPAAGATLTALTSVDSTSRSLALNYQWDCDGCQITRQNGSVAAIQAPDSGTATVSVRIAPKSGDQNQILASASRSFTVQRNPDQNQKKDKDSGQDQPTAPTDQPLDTSSSGDTSSGTKSLWDSFWGNRPQGSDGAPGPKDKSSGAQGAKDGNVPQTKDGQGPPSSSSGAKQDQTGTTPAATVSQQPSATTGAQGGDNSQSSASGALSKRGLPLIKLDVPAVIRADQFFEIKAILPPDVAAKVAKYHWSVNAWPENGISDTKEPHVKFYGYPWSNSINGSGWITDSVPIYVSAHDAQGNMIAETDDFLRFPQAPLKISAQVPSGWKMNQGDFGFNGERNAGQANFSNAHGSVYVSFTDLNSADSLEAIKKGATAACNNYNAMDASNKNPNYKKVPAVVQAVQIGGYSGYQCLRDLTAYNDTDDRCDLLGQSGGKVIKGTAVIEFDVQVNGSAYRKDQVQFIKSEARAMWQEGLAAVQSVTIGTSGGLTTGAGVDRSQGQQQGTNAVLAASLSADKTSLGLGESAKLAATATGGTPPYTFSWSAPATGKGSEATAAAQAGADKLSIAVEVKDAKGGTAKASLDIPLAKLTVTLAKKSPTGADVPAGGQAVFAVTLASNGKPVKASDYVIRWEPATEARFAKAEGPGVAENTATFTKPGKALVWAVALSKTGGTLATAGESNQIEINVGGSKITLSASPAQPKVGQEVVVTAVEDPKIADSEATYWWDDSQGGAGTGPTADQRRWKFTVKENKPVTVNAMLKSKAGGAELGRASLAVTPAAYAVSVANLGPVFGGETTKPRVWKPGVGLVTLDKEIAAFEDVGLRADIEPAPPNTPLRYKWSVNEGSTLSGGAASREARVQRATAGAVEATVEVRDASNTLLGTGAATVSVSYSGDEVKAGKQKAAELDKLKREAQQAWNDGDANAACDKAKAAAQIDPKYPEAASYCQGRDKIAELAGRTEEDLKAARIDKAGRDAAEIKKINPKAKVLADLEKKLQAASKDQDQAKLKEAERKRRVDAINAGAGECGNKNWQACKDKLSEALSGSEPVFGPQDAALAQKAKQLLATAEQKLAEQAKEKQPPKEKTKDQPKNQPQDQAKDQAKQKQAEHDRRVEAIKAAAAGECGKQNWQACKDKLAAAMAGSEAVFGPEDAVMVKNVKALQAEVEQKLAEQAKEKQPAKEKTKDQPKNQPQDLAKDQAKQKQAEHDRRVEAIKAAAAGECGKQNWQACKDKLAAAMAGSEAVFGPEDAAMVKNVKALQAEVEQQLAQQAKAKQQPAPPQTASQPVQPPRQAPSQAPPAKQPAPPPPPAPGVEQFDGAYAGTYAGQDQGQIQFTVSRGVLSGTIASKITTGKISGSVDAQGKVNCRINGMVQFNGANQFNGAFTGTIHGKQASGDWLGQSKEIWRGTWSAAR